MTVRGVARLCAAVTAATVFGLALLVRDTLRDITRACRLPAETRVDIDALLAGYEAHGWPHDDLTGRNVGWR